MSDDYTKVVGVIAPKNSAVDLAADFLAFVRKQVSKGADIRFTLAIAIRGEESDQHWRWHFGGSGIERIGDAAWVLHQIMEGAGK